jgi:tRNA-modifying protein YgfZ
LHGQLTQDFALLDTAHARLAALCSAKGRMLASFVGFKTSSEEVLLLCPKDILPATLKRLSMFVLRAKCQLVDASAQYQLVGAAGDAATSIGAQNREPWQLWTQGDAHWVSLYPASGCARAIGVFPVGSASPECSMSESAWQLSEVRSGVASISQPVVEAFVPQMLNYESIGGVNFKKGCYPGQEVVARSQFRGTLKRRAYLAQSSAPLHAGQEVFAASDASQACGTVVQAAMQGAVSHAIVSITIASADEALTVSSASGAALTLGTLPYPLLEDI